MVSTISWYGHNHIVHLMNTFDHSNMDCSIRIKSESKGLPSQSWWSLCWKPWCFPNRLHASRHLWDLHGLPAAKVLTKTHHNNFSLLTPAGLKCPPAALQLLSSCPSSWMWNPWRPRLSSNTVPHNFVSPSLWNIVDLDDNVYPEDGIDRGQERDDMNWKSKCLDTSLTRRECETLCLQGENVKNFSYKESGSCETLLLQGEDVKNFSNKEKMWDTSQYKERGTCAKGRFAPLHCCLRHSPTQQLKQLTFNLWRLLKCNNKLDFVNYAKLRLKVYEDMMMLKWCKDHILTENIWFVWSETSYSGDERRCHGCGTTNDDDEHWR